MKNQQALIVYENRILSITLLKKLILTGIMAFVFACIINNLNLLIKLRGIYKM